MSIIVVSDVHIGDESSNHEDFSYFVDWITSLENNGGIRIENGEGDIKIKPPEKIILLGDMMEMWNPKNNEARFAALKSFEPFGKLASLKCEKIFVLGNHDEIISKYLDKTILRNGKKIREKRFKINSDFTVIDRHYPEDPEDKEKGFLEVGNKKYFLIHGHQFDKVFRRLGPLSHLPTAIVNSIPSNWLLIMITLIIAVASYYYLEYKWISIAFSSIFIISIILKFIDLNKLNFKIENFFNVEKPKYKNIQEIINEKYYNVERDTTGPDVNFIFGHTHIPEMYTHKFRKNEKDHEKLFINPGSWVTEENRPHNTFVYIDEDAYLFKWFRGGNLQLIPRTN